jgi:hypothetical protein
MAEATALWELLRQTADPSVADALKSAVETGSVRSLNRVNPLALAVERGLNEEAAIGALVHAARPLRHVLEHALSGLRRRARNGRGLEDP